MCHLAAQGGDVGAAGVGGPDGELAESTKDKEGILLQHALHALLFGKSEFLYGV